MSKVNRRKKTQLLSLMDDQKTAARADLPTCEDILINTDHGCATLLPMIVGWCIAEFRGIISSA